MEYGKKILPSGYEYIGPLRSWSVEDLKWCYVHGSITLEDFERRVAEALRSVS